MSNAPADLLTFRAAVRTLTGLPPVSVGIVGDGAHQRTGGYHEGRNVLTSIGRFHGPAAAHAGSAGEDYSARLLRDRVALTDDASAVDIGDDWPHGGRAAWLRFNRAILAELQAGGLPGIRAINVSRDGVERKRYDCEHRTQGLINSADTVNIHTHIEFYRDRAGRAGTLDRLLALIRTAIDGPKRTESAPATPQPSHPEGDDDMFLIQLAGTAPVFLTDGVTARHITTEAELADIHTLIAEGLIRAKTADTRVVGRRELIGRIIGTAPGGFEDLTA